MKSCNPNGHIVDSRFYSGSYTTREAREIFCDLRRYQRWLDVEAALALAQADLGIIPSRAAARIRENAGIERLDLELIRNELRITGHSLMPLLKALEQACGQEAGRFIHYGATTQDIQDTAQVLEIRDVLTVVRRDLTALIIRVMELCERYEDLVTIGRTHNQHALPTTMGLKMAGWLDELWRQHQRLEDAEERLLVSQLFGGVGTMDGFGEQAFGVLKNFSARLGLRPPMLSWHASRDRIAEFLTFLALLGSTCARIAEEIRCLARNEVGEMAEPFSFGRIGSSTMPHKRNPEMCEQVLVLARLISSRLSPAFEGQINEHERDYRAVRLEWVSVTDASLYTCGLLDLMRKILDGLVIHEETVRKNVRRAAAEISTEALMFFLAPAMGKQAAHSLIYEASMAAVDSSGSLLDMLLARPEIAEKYGREEILRVIRPENHIGMALQLTRNTVARIRAALADHDPEKLDDPGCPLRTLSEKEIQCRR